MASHATPRRPLLLAAAWAGAVTLVGSSAAFIPDLGLSLPRAAALALVYGVILSGLVVGVLLAPPRAAGRLWTGGMLLGACLLALGIGVCLWPAAVVREEWFFTLTI
jgi:hypothetical protein